ncbi:hypothetical protein F5B22DRAFT_251966 [Xylaria bambusicola]|uniref:uncharacterized protein n=1 Tax=Xylaria bambusicola TaxID=326684 RepID=UPI00200796D9|nr:uncharacterized protein F5B22DRAFT_251966 [Xylaria bambusicola]KAI0525755.1 hypothetical protein F5B22DRAFT_251966 [Xylaria bambusicola]
MQPEKSLATGAEPKPVEDEPVDTDPRPGRPSTAHSNRSSRMRRHSEASVRSESCTRAPISCVSRGSISGDDCARQRFIVWAAVKRNRSTRMAVSERLRCPLLRCGQHFECHEEMLRHLADCQHLATGEYVCYDCMKVERFNDKKCTCCFGQPTKRRRIINMAKNFFSNIGSAKGRWESLNPSTNIPQSSRPVHEALVRDTQGQFSQAQMGESIPQEESVTASEQLASEQPQLELNGAELLELDSTPVLPTAELDAVTCNTLRSGMLDSLDSYAETRSTPLSPIPNLVPKPLGSQGVSTMLRIQTGTSGNGRRPSLALNTQVDHFRTKPRTTYLSPSSPLRTSSNGISPVTPWSTISKSSAIWSADSGRENMLASPITPLSANPQPTILQEGRMFRTEKDMDMLACSEDPCCYTQGNGPELPGNSQLSSSIPRLLSDPLLFPYGPNDSHSWFSSMNTEISLSTSVNMMFTDQDAKPTISRDFIGPQISGSEAKALVEQVWLALGQHFSNSISELSRLQHNPLADNFRVYTPRAVASEGLARFRKTLSHQYSAHPDPLEYLCFVHLIYAISLITYEESLLARSNKLYEQAIAYSSLFDGPQRDNYLQIVTTIWHQNSPESSSRGQIRDSTNRTTVDKGKEPDYQTRSIPVANPDPLVITGQNFLDELERIMVNGNIQQPLEVLSSELWSSHLTSNQPNLQGPNPLTIASTFLVQDLCRRYHDAEDFLPKLTAIGHNARAGYYVTIRKLELDLIQTGKDYFTSNDSLDQFTFQVRHSCDQIYSQSGTRSRSEYHLLGISLVDSLVRSVAREPQQPQQGQPEYPIMSYPYEDEFLREFKTFDWNYSMIPTTQQPGGVADYTPLDLSTLHSVTADTSHLPMRSDASETPSDTYTVSSAPLSDAPPDIPTPKTFRPTPPAMAQGEGSETLRHSTLASSGQKVEANERCEICGYRPKGDPQWFKGSMAKHKKMQHSTNPPIIYKCPFPGCNSEYKNRRDNLRQHQIEKNHFVGDERQIRRKRKERS